MTVWLTNKEKEIVEEEYKLIKENSHVPESLDLKVVFESSDIAEWTRIYSEINDMKISLQGRSF